MLYFSHIIIKDLLHVISVEPLCITVTALGHRPFLECALTKPKETYDACVHSCDDDSFFTLAKCHEGIGFNWRRPWRWLCRVEQNVRQQLG